ncbi:sulfur carrier protein ThiS [Clostridium sp. D2Q-14]|uniref:sulfur carrier protein ThiS n=1 Tax=Anaeromonas gelatinilytica TaxID=2683194 RepID=UPI00193AE8B9|nr:sulfur carrier protein ThiS [Anaeromonas gelatinilytica]MBS4534522.1 sulfur carrier protein ThiS [Anaeromonas gelatinilytica]
MIVNGKEMDFNKEITVSELLKELDINPNKVVVEVNLNIIDKNKYDKRKLDSNSEVEIIRFVGGG